MSHHTAVVRGHTRRRVAVCDHCPRTAPNIGALAGSCHKSPCLAPADAQHPGIEHRGGGWYRLPDGQTVQGYDQAVALIGGGTNEHDVTEEGHDE